MPGATPRDRLSAFRQLFLAFALFALGGIAVTLGFAPSVTTGQRVQVALSAVLIAAWWVYGHHTRRFPIVMLAVESALLVGFTMAVGDPPSSLAAYIIGIQYRALYGTRRDTWLLAFAYGFAFVIGVWLSSVGLAAVTPVVLVEVLALGFCVYLLHTLAEVLERDLSRTLDLRRSEDRYRVLFENNPWPTWVFDPTTFQILDVNEASVRQYGYTRAEFLGMTIRDLRGPEDLAAFDQLRPEIQSDRRVTFQVRHRKKNGDFIDVQITGDSIDVDSRRARIAIGVDVTDRERAGRALRESESRFRSVAENLREALMITDADDRITLANSAVRDVLGYEPEEVVGKTATELFLPASQQNVFREKLNQRLNGEAELYEAELIRKDGSRMFAEVSASPYRDETGKIIGTLGAISDISERRTLQDRLRQAMRMEVVGQLAGGVAHDFNNLLTVIKCHTELLLTDAENTGSVREGVQEIAKASDRAASLTQQLLAFSRKQVLQPRKLSLAAVVSDAAPILRSVLGEKLRLVTRNAASVGVVHADPMQLESVLVALVRNAAEAMPKGGDVVIETRALVLVDATPPGSTLEMPAGQYAVLSVSDSGVGMNQATRAKLFEPFFTTKGPGEGSGLGLASVYGIVRQSGGFVDVETAPNVGTTFRIYLPLSNAKVSGPVLKPELQPA